MEAAVRAPLRRHRRLGGDHPAKEPAAARRSGNDKAVVGAFVEGEALDPPPERVVRHG